MSQSTRDSNRDLSSSVLDSVSRRQLLIGGLVAGGSAIGAGVYVSSGKDDVDELTVVENKLVRVATRVDTTDLSNPRVNYGLQQTASMAVESVNQLSNDELPAEPGTQQRLQAISSAADYYRHFIQTLDAGRSVVSQLAESESAVITYSGNENKEFIDDITTEEFKGSVTGLSENTLADEPTTPDGEELIPTQDSVINELRSQQKVLDHHLKAQQAYMESSVQIPSAVRALEQSRYEAAKRSLQRAEDSLLSGSSTLNTTPGLEPNGLSLQEYTSIFELRREGVAKLLSVSTETVPADQRQEMLNTAIGLFLESRAQVV